MQRAKSNRLILCLLLIVASTMLLAAVGCGGNDRGNVRVVQKDVVVETSYAGEGLDLEAVGVIFQEVKNSEELEQRINEPGGVNNVDLNEDGQVDFIRVQEFAGEEEGSRGMSLVAVFGEGEENEQPLAEIYLVRSGDSYDMEVHGNERVYGGGHYYHHSVGDILLASYLYHAMWSPWYSPYYFGRPYGFYRPYAVVPMTSYRSTVMTTTSRSTTRMTKATANHQSKVSSSTKNKNPNKGKVGNVRAPIKNPTSSQKAFQERNPSKKVPEKKGFSSQNKKQSNTGSGPNVRPQPTKKPQIQKPKPQKPKIQPQRRNRGFGGGSRGFGGGRRR